MDVPFEKVFLYVRQPAGGNNSDGEFACHRPAPPLITIR